MNILLVEGSSYTRNYPRNIASHHSVALTAALFSINSLPPWEILHAFLLSADFFQNNFFFKILSGISSECQTD